MFDYGELAQATVGTICNAGEWHRAVSIDLETKIEKKSDFLTGERLLGIGFARRTQGKVEVRTFRLKDDSDGAEAELMDVAARYLHTVKPLLLLGYNIAGYDYPLLALKVKWYDDRARAACAVGQKPVFAREYWALKDALTRAFVLDMMHSLRFDIARHDNTTPKYRSLAFSVAHPKFASLPLMRRKGLADVVPQVGTAAVLQAGTSNAPSAQEIKGNDAPENKGKKIYEMWKSNDPAFEQYLEGDVHDVLLLAEEIYGVSESGGKK